MEVSSYSYARRLGPVIIAVLTTVLCGAHAYAETLIVAFSRRLMEPQKAAIEADAKHELTIIPNKSLPGLIALIESRAHLAMISAPLRSEIEALQTIMPGLAYDRLKVHEVVKTRIALALHPLNPLRKAS